MSNASSTSNNQSTFALACSCVRLIPLKMLAAFTVFCLTQSVQAQSNADSLLESLNQNISVYAVEDTAQRGQLRPVNYTVLGAGISAIIQDFPVRTGFRINEGDIIAEFDCDVEVASLNIEKAKKNVADKNYEINQRLFNLKNISELELSISESERNISAAEVQRAEAVIDDCVLRAPFSGIVTEKFAQSHQYVSMGEPLVELVDTRNMEVEMVLSSLRLGQYLIGAEFSILLDETGQTVTARIDRVVDVIDPVSQTIKVIGTLVSPPEGLMPGMSGEVLITQ